jgi:hypothetical protein
MKVGGNLAITVASHPYNFLILSGDSNHIKLLRHCYNTTKTGNAAGAVMGIYGNRETPQFKASDPTQALSALLQPPHPKRKDKKTKQFIPFLEIFPTAKTEKEFEKLEGYNKARRSTTHMVK